MTLPELVTPEALDAAGWRRRSGDRFNATLGTIWFAPEETRPTIGIFVEEPHTNLYENLHGGALMTFADICLGYGASKAVDHKPMVTADLHLQFVSRAGIGDFVYGQPEVVRMTRSLIFVRSLICSGESTVASASGIWKILNPGASKES